MSRSDRPRPSTWTVLLVVAQIGCTKILFRLYGPKKELFDKAWALPDLQPVD